MQTTALPAGSRARVIPSLTIRASQRIGAPASSAPRAAATKPGENRISGASPTIPAAWIMRTATRSSSGANRARSASARIVANDRA